MRVLRTTLATDWPEAEAPSVKLLRVLLWFIPRANPDYDGKYHSIREWLVEFDDHGNPSRELGLNERGAPIVAGPDSRNHGYWPDTNMRFSDFEGEEVNVEEFATIWDDWIRMSQPDHAT